MTESKPQEYRVLARKYRPQSFDELIGQDALVRTLKNAIETGRIAHAFMLTGVRGVGKTTTARIIAKALNYTGSDGKAGPTTGSTEDCQLCQAISEDRHPDVMEMDAASRTGVDDIREILDGVRYAPSEARYKVYIIDEVHMLSKQAFNALLKTLEEPPEHVKFIFATTEIRKVPITVLSRCQRFDLRRVDVPTLSAHFASICEKEGVTAEDEAVALISRAADGSVRDGLSLLDQAIALSGETITVQQVQDMLGLADRAKNLDLLENALTGNMPEALAVMDDLYRAGADPVVMMQDLLDLTHILTRMRSVPDAQDISQAMAADQVERAGKLSRELSMPSLGKTWQILLKGLNEVQMAPNPQAAAEMVIIRLAYAADLPDPVDLIKKLQNEAGSAPSAPSGGGGSGGSAESGVRAETVNAPVHQVLAPTTRGGGPMASQGLSVVASAAPEADEDARPDYVLKSLVDVVMMLEAENEILLASNVRQYAHPVKFEHGRIEIRPQEEAPQRLSQDLAKALQQYTGERWMVTISGAAGQPTLSQVDAAEKEKDYQNVLALPEVQKILSIFPEAQLTAITDKDNS